jgi:hypothetical protein
MAGGGGREGDSDGSDTFWPGYVDAVTNLVLNLLFLLTIMTVAVFMFALELGRASKGGPSNPADTKQELVVKPVDPVKENRELKKEIQRLSAIVAQRDDKAGVLARQVEVTSVVATPQTGVDRTLLDDAEVMVRFRDDAVAFTPAEREQVLEALKPIVASGKANIFVEIPPGFTEAKRMGFYRAMAVRNLLLELKMPKDRINVTEVEGKSSANASVVKVRTY